MSRENMQHWMSRIKPYTMLIANVVGFTERGAALISHLQILENEDNDLVAVRDELLVPVIIRTRLFGALVLDRRIGSYDGTADWCGVRVRLSISCSDHANPNASVTVAESLFHAQEDWNRRVKDFAADRLLELKNESWLGDDKALSREEFISRMKLEEISVDEDGGFSFWHDDGDLFFGHTILITGDLVSGLTDADIPG